MNRTLIGFVFGIAVLLWSGLAYSEGSSGIPQSAFRDLVVSNHFDPQKAAKQTIGLEIEAGGLDEMSVVNSLIKELGGTYVGEKMHLGERAHFIEGTKVGDIRVEPVNLSRFLTRMKEANPNTRWDNALVRGAIRFIDRQIGTYEIVTEPLHYDQASVFADAVDKLGQAGARGTSAVRLVSTQINHGIDPKDVPLIKNILANYYANHRNIRDDIKPHPLRKQYIQPITDQFLAKLRDPSWKPTIGELYDEYLENSQDKLSSINLFNALIMDDANFKKVVQPTLAKPRLPRPVAEFREANTKMSSAQRPVKSSTHIMRQIDFAISLVEASRESGQITFDSEVALYQRKLALKPQAPRGPPTGQNEIPTLKETLDGKYFTPLKTRPIPGASVFLSNADVLNRWGVTGDRREVNAKLLAWLGVEIDDSHSPTGTVVDDPGAPYATAHNDGAGGRGDGRSLNLDELNGWVINAKGLGLTPYQIQQYAVWLGFHIGGVDGRASLAEGLRSYLTGELLNKLGIPSERIVAIFDNKKISSHGGNTEPSAIIARQLPGGAIRNSHLNVWDATQTRKGLEYLKEIASRETGFKQTDSTFILHDARKSAEIAARMQDAYIVHGALTAGNVLAYPGVVDLNTVTFLAAPDPAFTPIAQRSAFGLQASTLRRQMLARQQAYEKANPTLHDINAGKVFDDAFKRELSLLALERLGLERGTAEKLFETQPDRVKAYTDHLWKAQFGHLQSDLQRFQTGIAENYADRARTPNDIAQALLKEVNDPNREIMNARRTWLQKLDHWISGRRSFLTEKEAHTLVLLGTGLLDSARALSGETAPGAFEAKIAERARAKGAFTLPSNREMKQAIDDVVQAKMTNQPMATALKEIQYLVYPERDPQRAAKQAAKVAEQRKQWLEKHAARFAGDLVNSDNILNHVKILAGEKPVRNGLTLSNRHSDANKALAAEYLMRQLSGWGYQPAVESFPAGRRLGKNIIAEKRGTQRPKDIIEVVVHYDSRSPIVTGADDNASGVAAALEMARIFQKLNPEATIRFVFSDLEEAGLLGSEAHVDRGVVKPGEHLVGAFVLDTIGHHPQSTEKVLDMVVGANPANRALANQVMSQEAKYRDRPLRVFPITLAPTGAVADHGPYWDADLPALFFRQNYEHFSPAMHIPGDTTALINPQYLGNVTRMVQEAISSLAGVRVPKELAADFYQRAPQYDRAYNPNIKADTDFVALAKPNWQLLTRLASLVNLDTLNNRLQRMKEGSDRAIQRDYAEERNHLSQLAEQAATEADEPTRMRLEADLAVKVESFARKWNLKLAPNGGQGCGAAYQVVRQLASE